ncbi:MAG: RNA polymerase sigma-70 factor (ECF subfamily) [Verrucomicrobiales bacterium]
MSIDNDELVEEFYQPLFRFALSLTKAEPDAVDLVQQTFLRWGQKGHQLRDETKVKSWLFTTLHREFLGSKRRQTKFPHIDMEKAEAELPNIASNVVDKLDADIVLEALQKVDDKFRSALALFYLKEHSYKEIASVLDIPIGTVMSRISRGKSQLRDVLAQAITVTA